MRPNWFFAFPIDGAFVASLPDVPTGIRRFPPEDVHLTVAFLGGCGEAGAERGLLALERALAGEPLSPIQVSLGEVVPMGSVRRYSALSALVERGRERTEMYIRALGDRITEAAIDRIVEREPKAHVTLARPMRRATDAQRRAGVDWARGLDLRGVCATLDRIAVYTWNENRRERLFRVVAERSLG